MSIVKSSNSLPVFETVTTEDGFEVLVNPETKETGLSVKGYARLSGKDKSTISRRLQGVALDSQKRVETLTAGGLQGVALIPEDLILFVLLFIPN